MQVSQDFKNRFLLIVRIFFIGFLAFYAGRLFYYHYHILTFPYPVEYREASMIMSADALLKGLNPFSLKLQPAYTNVYGIVYPLVVYPFARIWGGTTYVHRAVSAVFLFLSCGLLGMVMHKKKVPLLLNICGVVMFYALLLFPRTTTPASGPATLGLFLFLLSIYIPDFCRYSLKSLVTAAALAVLAFYTKPYFILSIPALCCFLFLFVSKKKGLIYAGFSFLLFLGTVFVMHKIFEVYFNNVFFIHSNATFNEWMHFVTQFKEYVRIHKGLLILLSAGVLFILKEYFMRTFKKEEPFQQKLKGILKTFNIRSFREPLLKMPFDITVFFLLVFFAVLCFRLGRNRGAWMWYFFQLLSPFFIVVVFDVLRRFKKFYILIVPVLVLNLYVMTAEHDFFGFFQNKKLELQKWKAVEALVSQHKNILNSPIIATLLVHQNKPVYDNGLSEYFKMGAYRERFKNIFPPDKKVMLRHYEFMSEVTRMLREKSFDLILVSKAYAPLTPGIMPQYYQYMGDIRLFIPHNRAVFDLTIWRPK